MYKVLKFFVDLQDKNFPYNKGDIHPRANLTVSEERLAELSGSNNKQGEPLIELEKNDGGIENMKLEELKAYAEEKGINLDGLTRKADILAKIQEVEAATV